MIDGYPWADHTTAFSVRDQDIDRPHACTTRLDRLVVADIDLGP
jgi:hypothetical protein